MMKDNKKNIDLGERIEEMIEKYRFYIGLFLIILIFSGAGFLLWRENYSKPKLESRIMNLESRISELDQKLQETRNPSTSSGQANSNPPAGGQTEQGQIAGTSTQEIPKQVRDDNKVTGKININTASTAQLDSLPGIGATYAGRIIEYRNSHGGFKNIEEIKNVKGIGDKTFEKFKDQITI